MRHNYIMKALLAGALTLLTTGAMAETKTVTVTMSDVATANSWTSSTAVTTFTSGGITFTAEKGSGQNAPMYYTSGSALRIYQNNTLTISAASGFQVTAVTGAANNKNNTNITFPEFTISNGVATYTATEQVRFVSFTVTYTDDQGGSGSGSGDGGDQGGSDQGGDQGGSQLTPGSVPEGTVALVAVKDGQYYACSTTQGDNQHYFEAEEVTVAHDLVCSETPSTIAWKVTVDNDANTALLQPEEGKYLADRGTDKSDVIITETETHQTVNNDGDFSFTSFGRYLGLNTNVTPKRFALYKSTTTYPAAHAMPFADYFRLNLTVGQYGTMVLPRAVAADKHVGATFYTISSIADGQIQLAEVTGDLVAGQPYLFEATEKDVTIEYSEGTDLTAPLTDDYLVGTFADGTVQSENGSNWVLQQHNGKFGFYYVDTVEPAITANHCYLHYTQAPAGVKFMAFDTATGLSSLAAPAARPARVYNVLGQRLAQPRKGLNIVGGRKVVVK